MQKDLCLEWLPVDSLQSSYMGKKQKLKDLCLEGLHVDFGVSRLIRQTFYTSLGS
jgi:hypothetical protein